MRTRLGMLLLAGMLRIPVFAQAPTGLTVKTATSKRVDLTWSGTAASYTVQRAVLGGAYSTIASATTASYSDTTIDPYTTYQYQILNGTAASGSVTVGPPPSGISNIAPAPVVGTTPSDSYGENLSMALDGNGDPAIIFIWDDPNANSDHTINPLYFRSWNRAKYAWNPVVKLGVVGDVATYFHPVTSLAYDSGSGNFAAISEVAKPEHGPDQLNLYVSGDGGSTWTLKNTFDGGGSDMLGPSLAIANGVFHLAYEQDTVGTVYVTGQLSQSPSTWTTKKPSAFPGAATANYSTGPSLALDSAGNPGVAYWVLDDNSEDNNILVYWKPASNAAPIKITDTQNNGDGNAVKLTFYKLNPRVVMWAQRLDGDFGVGVHFAHSEDGGLTWATPVLVPPDGSSSSDYPFDMALDSKDDVAIVFGQNSNSGDQQCGDPKLSLSTDLTHFKTCSFADLSVTGSFSVYPGGLQVAYGGNDKLYLLWLESSDTQANTGILMYREPPAGAISGPQITDVVNGATFQPGIVAGSWTTIKGANLADVTRTWGDPDFTNGDVLPTNLSGVSVKINGLDAPVYFISQQQINVQAPQGISGNVSVQVTHSGAVSNTVTANAVSSAPGLFTYSLGGRTFPSALYNGTVTIVGDPALYGQAAKAKAGDIIQLYATGLGPSPAGNIIRNLIPFGQTVTVTIGSTNTPASFAGLVGVGLFQINFTVPSGLADGDYPLAIKIGNVTSQSGVIIPITH